MESSLRISDRRSFKDRRRQPTPGLSKFILAGRRTIFRRSEERKAGGYVDRYGSGLFFLLVLILGLNLLDAFLTMLILRNGGQELNPVVCFAIRLFGDKFWIWKFLWVSIPLILLCVHNKFRPIMPVLWGISAVYTGVVLFQFFLIMY